MAYDTKSIGLDGSPKAFAKPIMMLLLMFTGMYENFYLFESLNIKMNVVILQYTVQGSGHNILVDSTEL